MIASTFIALLLTGSSRASASHSDPVAALHGILEVQILNLRGRALFASADYTQARRWFLDAADKAQRFGDTRSAAMNWTNAGSCSIQARQYRAALPEFEHARSLAQRGRHLHELLFVMNGIADLYVLTGQPDKALQVASTALREPFSDSDRDLRARILCELAGALVQLKRFDESVPYYLRAVNALLDVGDYAIATRALAALGNSSVSSGHLEIADWALSLGLRMSRLPRTSGPASSLTGIGQLRTAQGRPADALRFFEAALNAPASTMPPWRIYAERGKTRLSIGDFRGALTDFREAHRIVVGERADIVPADQDRVAFESGLSTIMEGLVNAGNSLAWKTGDRTIPEETFNAAEEDRQWSLRLLIPSPSDWRDRLPPRYWELLSQYQSLARARDAKATELGAELQRIEASAASSDARASRSESALRYLRSFLSNDSVLFSFHTSETGCWMWAVDRQSVDLYPLPPLAVLRARTSEFRRQVETGSPSSETGLQLYRDVFGSVAPRYVRHSRWSLELDGPLYELPFPALPTAIHANHLVYLAERASTQAVPGALLLKRSSPIHGGLFVGVGDPVYNTADDRFTGKRVDRGLSLPRLTNTEPELRAAAQSWNAPRKPIFLTGPDAEPNRVRQAVSDDAAVIHFATHVVAEHGDFDSGMIALSLNQNAEMQLLGPKEIVARPVRARLVVMNGCHSAQGRALPSAGLMGLTRAWIGAGAEAVLATHWDVPDTAAQNFMIDFYTALRSSPEAPADALRHAEVAAIRRGEPPSAWSGYSLLSRIQ
jgi:CHAT domain-containing protein